MAQSISSIKKVREKTLERYVERGHLQRGIYGDRVIYHENDKVGEMAIKGGEGFERMQRDWPYLFILSVLVVSTIITAVTWPKMLYKYVTSNN